MAHAAPVVVVTGATGFVASELVKQLLEKGYTVRGTVRSLHNEGKVQHLERLGKALPGQLTLHEADLLKVCSCTSLNQHLTFQMGPWTLTEATPVHCRRAHLMALLQEPRTSSTQREHCSDAPFGDSSNFTVCSR